MIIRLREITIDVEDDDEEAMRRAAKRLLFLVAVEMVYALADLNHNLDTTRP